MSSFRLVNTLDSENNPKRLNAWQEKLKAEWKAEGEDRWKDNHYWERYLGYKSDRSSNQPHKHDKTDTLISLAKTFKPDCNSPENWVTSFSDWLLSFNTRGKRSSRVEGKVAEFIVDKRELPEPKNKDWGLWFKDFGETRGQAMPISALAINGHPLYGKPDLVFKHASSERFVVIERKASNALLPPNSWPSVRAQLWAYSQLDALQSAEEISLVAEIWPRGFRGGRLVPRMHYRWDAATSDFSDIEQLFQIYKSHRESINKCDSSN